MLPLVRRAALEMRRRLPPHVELDDLIAAGHLGLLDGLTRFDSTRRVPLACYLRRRIRGAILDELRAMDHAPRSLRREGRRVERAHRNLEVKLGRSVTHEELAQQLGLTIAEWHQTTRRLEAIRVSSWPRAGTRIETSFALETLIDSNADPFEECYRSEIRKILGRACATLPSRQQFILAMYYARSLTLRKIAAELGVDASRVSQLHSQALVQLRRRVSQALRSQAGWPLRKTPIPDRRREAVTGNS